MLTKKLLEGGKKDVEQVAKKKINIYLTPENPNPIASYVKSFVKSRVACVFGEL